MSELSDFVKHLDDIVGHRDTLVEDEESKNLVLRSMEVVLRKQNGSLSKPSQLANLFAMGFELGVAYQQAIELRQDLNAAQLPVPSDLWNIAVHSTGNDPSNKKVTTESLNKVIQLFKESDGSNGPENQ